MSRYQVQASAEDDLDDIWLYIAHDSELGADRVLTTLYRSFLTLADFPRMGRKRPELAKSLRSYVVGNYVVFYLPTVDGIDVVRVLSGFRDIDAEFGLS